MDRPTGPATAYWTLAPGRGELRSVPIAPPGPGQALVRTLASGVSRGTELLVHRGEVPEAVRALMRAPFQEGDLPGPVKYGYLSVGVVESVGSRDDGRLVGRRVFCLYPHQDRYVVPVTALTALPDDVPADRGVLVGTVETAVNAVWDAAPRLGDRVAVVGAGMVGASVAAVLSAFPLDRLQLVDVDPARARLAAAWDVEFRTPADADGDCDVVLHCSATAAGLDRGLELLGEEGELVELSWYGDREAPVHLGRAFHARRLRITASQVGAVAAARRARRDFAARKDLAARLLRDARFGELVTSRGPFTQLPATLAAMAAGELPGLCHVVEYDERNH